MKIAIDIHIHSGLSPCADDSMTPNNIINMAKLKELDAIAITDHNSLKNVTSFLNVALKNNIICIPGVEITTKEEVHMLGYFRSIDAAYEFQGFLDKNLPVEKNNTQLFGHQYIYNEDDEILEDYERLLSNSIRVSVEEVVAEIRRLKGVPIPAHINRKRFSIISNLGFINPSLSFNAIEICSKNDTKHLEILCPNLNNYNRIYSSDAHSLGQILEREFFVEVKELSIDGILNALDKGGI